MSGDRSESGSTASRVRGPRIVGIIPARLAATRLPNKPLLDIGGMTMLLPFINGIARKFRKNCSLSRSNGRR